MLTDRVSVVACIVQGDDPSAVTAGDLAQGKPITNGDDDVSEALATVKEHQVRRLPVIDGHVLVCMRTQADVARSLPVDRSGDLLKYLSEPSASRT